MSTYATLAELKAVLGNQASSTDPGSYDQLSDLVTAVTANDTVGQNVIDIAESIVDSYLGRRYAVPVTVSVYASAGALCKRSTLAIAVWQLWSNNSRIGNDIPDRVQKAYESTIDLLERIADGSSVLPAATPIAESGVAGASAYGAVAERVFDPDAMSRF